MSILPTDLDLSKTPGKNAGQFVAFDSLLMIMLEKLSSAYPDTGGAGQVFPTTAGKVFDDIWDLWESVRCNFIVYADLATLLNRPYELSVRTAGEIREAARKMVELYVAETNQTIVSEDEAVIQAKWDTNAKLGSAAGIACALYRLAKPARSEDAAQQPLTPEAACLLEEEVGVGIALRKLALIAREKIAEAYPEASHTALSQPAKGISEDLLALRRGLEFARSLIGLFPDLPVKRLPWLSERVIELSDRVIKLALAEQSRYQLSAAAGIACAMRHLVQQGAWTDELQRALNDAADAVKPLLDKATGAVKPLVEQATEAVKPLLDKATEAVKPVVERATEAAKPLLKQATAVLKQAWEGATGAVKPVVDEAKSKIQPALDEAREVLADLWKDAVVEVTTVYFLRLADPSIDLTVAVPGLKIIVQEGDLYVVAVPKFGEAALKALDDAGKVPNPTREQCARLQELHDAAQKGKSV